MNSSEGEKHIKGKTFERSWFVAVPLVGGARPDGELVCLTVYRKGAREVVRRLAD